MADSHFDPDARTLPELAVGICEECLSALDGPESLDNEETVHLFRVSTKRLRAAWHLDRKIAGSSLSKERRKALRGLSACLAGARDQSVLLDLIEDLRHSEGDLSERATDALNQAEAQLREPPGSRESPAVETESVYEQLLLGWKAEKEAWRSTEARHTPHPRRAIRHQLRQSRRKAEKLTRQALKSEDPALWHEWRKSVKRLRYQREFVAAIQQRKPGKTDERISLLGSRLGERNDLANLAHLVDQWKEQGLIDAQLHGALRQIIAGRERHLKRNIRRHGRKLLSRKGRS